MTAAAMRERDPHFSVDDLSDAFAEGWEAANRRCVEAGGIGLPSEPLQILIERALGTAMSVVRAGGAEPQFSAAQAARMALENAVAALERRPAPPTPRDERVRPEIAR